MARYTMGEVVRHQDDLFIYWNAGVSNGINQAVIERLDDYDQRDLPRFQAVRLDSISKVPEAEQVRAKQMRTRCAVR